VSKTRVVLYDVQSSDTKYFHQAFDAADYDLTLTDQDLTPETAPMAAAADVISARVMSRVTTQIMEGLPNLKHIACRSTGFDHVDREYAAAHDITVSSVPSYGESTVAEYTILLLLAASRRLVQAVDVVRSGRESHLKLTGHDLDGKTLGIIGTGRIGRHAIHIARGFGMKVLAYDAFPQESAAVELGFQYVALDELIAASDAISLHAPATPETFHMLSTEQFARMKQGVIIVNTARGTLIDTPALINALVSGHIGAVGLDVLEGENYLGIDPELHLLEKDDLTAEAKQVIGIHILDRLPNVLITAHNAYNSVEALGRIRDTTVANIAAWRDGHPTNLVPEPHKHS
jgi:D-lactate dehydrogenase